MVLNVENVDLLYEILCTSINAMFSKMDVAFVSYDHMFRRYVKSITVIGGPDGGICTYENVKIVKLMRGGDMFNFDHDVLCFISEYSGMPIILEGADIASWIDY